MELPGASHSVSRAVGLDLFQCGGDGEQDYIRPIMSKLDQKYTTLLYVE